MISGSFGRYWLKLPVIMEMARAPGRECRGWLVRGND